jgi:hypothetical protein
MSRCFAFGCSFTNWFYPTWADFIGYNFDEYYNYAKGATSNTTMFHRFIEVDKQFTFTKDDMILWGLSGLGRYNFFVEKEPGVTNLFGCGLLNVDDEWIDSHPKNKKYSDLIKFARDKFWQQKWGLYYTNVAVNNVTRLCKALGIKLHIIAAMDIDVWIEQDLTHEEKELLVDIKDKLHVPISLQEFDEKNYTRPFPIIDNHPFIDGHWGFVKKYFPEYVSEKNTDYFNRLYNQSLKYPNEETAFQYLQSQKNTLDFKLEQKLYAEYT